MIEINEEKLKLSQKEHLNWNSKQKAPYDPSKPYFDPRKYHVFRLCDWMFKDGYRSVRTGKVGRPTGPRSIQLDPYYSIEDESGVQEFRYARKKQTKTVGGHYQHEYTPVFVEFPQAAQIVTKNPELWYWLINHPRCAESPNKSKKKPLFYLENKQKEAAKKVDAIKNRRLAEDIIFDMEEEELITFAQFHGMPNAGSIHATDEERRSFLLAINPKRILDSVESDDVDMMAVIMSAVDHRIIKYMDPSRKWHFCDTNGKLKDIIHTVRPQEEKFESLCNYLKKYDKNNTFKVIKGLVEEAQKEAVAQ